MVMSLGSFATRTVATLVVATDGTGDFTDIQTAINALPATGGCVYVKEGTYTITATITITSSNVALKGCGASTIIYLANGVNDHVIHTGDNANAYANILVEDIKLDGNKGSNVGILVGIYVDGLVTDSAIRNCWIKDCDDYGIYIRANADRNIIQGNNLYDNGEHGIYVFGVNEGNLIVGNTAHSNGGTGIFINSVSGPMILAENMCINNSEYGIILAANNSVIESCLIKNNTLSGIYVTHKRNVIIGNTIRNNGQHGIQLYASDENSISNNTIRKNSQTTHNTYDGIHLTNSSDYNTIVGNTVYKGDAPSQQRYGIRENAAADDNNIILGNTVREGGATGDISIQGANTNQGHNQI